MSNTENIINLTPHIISIQLPNGEMLHVQPSGKVARVITEEKSVCTLTKFSIPAISRTMTEMQDLPKPSELEGKIFIVSSLVLEKLPIEYSGYVFAPDTGDTAIRHNGQVIAVTRLVGTTAFAQLFDKIPF